MSSQQLEILELADLRKLIAFLRQIGFPHHDRRPRFCADNPQLLLDLALPLRPPSRNSYVEVATYSGRWFLRNGYHRLFRLLNQSVYLVRCVVVYAESVVEMGTVGARFFSGEVPFSAYPPMVTDFLNEERTVRYCRPLPERTIPSTIQRLQESLATHCSLQEVV